MKYTQNEWERVIFHNKKEKQFWPFELVAL